MTLGKVAERAGVAVDTARKVLREDPSVRPYIRERVLKAVKELDYHPNLVARALRDKSLKIIPISVTSLSELYFAEIAWNLSRELVDIGMEPALCFNPQHLLRMSQSFSTSGSLVVSGVDADTLRKLGKRQKVVTVDSAIPEIPSIGRVDVDLGAIYTTLARALLARGRKRIAIVSEYYLRCITHGWPPQKMPYVFETLAQAGLHTAGKGKDYVFRSSAELLEWIDANPGSVDAAICENDIEAAKMVAEMSARRLKTPDDILVVGCDGNLSLHGTWTIRIDTQYMAKKAVEMLSAMLDGNRAAGCIMHLPQIIDEAGNAVSA